MSNEVRRLLVKFPNVSKVVVDCRGLGDAFPAFMSQPWTDPETNKEYPPLVPDEGVSLIHNAVPLIRMVIANNTFNHQMVSATTIAFEKGAIELPVNSLHILGNHVAIDEDGESTKKLTKEEKAIFVETDALQIEMGNIIGKQTAAGGIVYDVAKATQHKDRYSALGMALKYIGDLEEERKNAVYSMMDASAIGIVTKF